MAALLLGGGEARAQIEVERWSADLTPFGGDQVVPGGENTLDDQSNVYGYAGSVSVQPGGMLSPSTFDYSNVTYTVDRLWLSTSNDTVVFETSPGLPDDAGLVLRLPTFRTSAVGGCSVGGDEDFDLEPSSASSFIVGRFVWRLPSSGCLTSETWVAAVGTTGTVKLVGPSNAAPTITSPTSPATFDVEENRMAVVKVRAEDGDDIDDVTGYSITGGADRDSFSIGSTSGELAFEPAPSFEDPRDQGGDNTYEVTVGATGGTNTREKTATRTITVTVTDVAEKPGTPDAPAVEARPGSETSLEVGWTEPDLNGGPALVGYEVRYRQGATGGWRAWPEGAPVIAGTSTVITGLAARTPHEVQVRALNGEAAGDWSEAATGVPAIPPAVESVIVASAPQSGNTYHWGETVVFTATFSEPVRVTGRPGLEVGLDDPAGTSGSTVQAGFWGLSENGQTGPGARPAPVSRYVHFAYTVQPFDRDADGVRIGADALRLASGDVIRSDETGARAELAHAAPGRLTGHRVDGRTTVDGEPAAPAAGAGIRFVDRDGNPLRTLANGRRRLTVPEGGSARYGLRLETRPAHAVVVSHHYAYEGDPDLAVPRDLMGDRSIAPDEWNTRTVWVEVEAAQDFDAEDGERVFENRAASNDASYHDLALPDVVAVEADDDAPTCRLDPGDVWCGVITVGEERGFYGYHRFYGYGDLSDDDFVVGTNRHAVQMLIVAGQKGIENDGNLTFELSERPDAAGEAALDELTLHLDSDRFRLSDAEPDRPGRYYWVDAGMNWSGEEYVIARLRRDSSSSGGRALQGRFISPPGRHDGAKRVKVRVGFSEPIDESPENVGEHGVDVEGGEVTSVRAVGGNAPGGSAARSTTRSLGGRNAGQQDREVVWEFEIEPDSDGDVTVSLEAGRPCGETGAICTADGRALSAGISTTVTAAAP